MNTRLHLSRTVGRTTESIFFTADGDPETVATVWMSTPVYPHHTKIVSSRTPIRLLERHLTHGDMWPKWHWPTDREVSGFIAEVKSGERYDVFAVVDWHGDGCEACHG